MKRPILNNIIHYAASASLVLLSAMISTHAADATTSIDANTQLQNARQTQIICRPNQGDPLGRQCHQGNR